MVSRLGFRAEGGRKGGGREREEGGRGKREGGGRDIGRKREEGVAIFVGGGGWMGVWGGPGKGSLVF